MVAIPCGRFVATCSRTRDANPCAGKDFAAAFRGELGFKSLFAGLEPLHVLRVFGNDGGDLGLERFQGNALGELAHVSRYMRRS